MDTLRSLFTWIDVEAILLEKQATNEWPKQIVGISAFYDSLDIRIADEGAKATVTSSLQKWFSDRFDAKSSNIRLEATSGSQRLYPVRIEITDETERTQPSFRPTFSQVAVLPDQLMEGWQWPTAFPEGTPPIIVFQSFKGGVGRTIHLLGLVAALSRQGKRVLLVDADLEAPGITWLSQNDEFGETSIAFVDFLALVHADGTPDRSGSIPLTAEKLSSQIFRTPGSQTPHLLLPAFRDNKQMLRLEVRPENLSLGPNAVWDMTEAIAALSRAVNVDAVLVDLRAGLSELASPFLFDPRIQRVLVSSLSQQSVEGTRLVLEQLAKLSPSIDKEYLSDPSVILSFVTPESEKSERVDKVRERLYEVYPNGENEMDQDATTPRLQIIDTSFAQDLLVVDSLSDAFRRLEGKDIVRKLEANLTEWMRFSEGAPVAKPGVSGSNADELRTKLKDYTKKLEFAESGEGEEFLVTPQLENLAQKFQFESPIAVIIGPKGAGKTYTYLQLMRAMTWLQFAKGIAKGVPSKNAGIIWPLLRSKNLEDKAISIIDGCRNAACDNLGLDPGRLPAFTECQQVIGNHLKNKRNNESDWQEHWFELIAKSLGVKANGDAVVAIVAWLREQRQRLVVTIDGLEEIFNVRDQQGDVALRSLLQNVPSRLKEIPDCPLGLLIFIRKDLVQRAIVQNIGQFEKLYEPYKFKWDVERAIQLVVWICERTGVPITYPEGKSAQTVTVSEAVELLIFLWGRKLGSDKSREARSAVYVMSALADFNEEIQARDLVRLLSYAADQSVGQGYPDRLLIPRAVREAIAPCGKKKIEEVTQENQALDGPFKKLLGVSDSEKRLPFSASDLDLTGVEIDLLKANGVIKEYKTGYALAENYRRGLEYKYTGKGRGPSYVRIPKAFGE